MSDLEFYITEIIQDVYVWLFFFSILLLCASDMLSFLLKILMLVTLVTSGHLVHFNELIPLNEGEI